MVPIIVFYSNIFMACLCLTSVNFGTVELNQTYNLHCSTSMLLWIESTPILLPLNILNCDCCSCIY